MGASHSTKGSSASSVSSQEQPFVSHHNNGFVVTSAIKMDLNSGGVADEEEEDLESQQEFHNTVRENIIFLLFFLTLIGISSYVIGWMSSPDIRSSTHKKTSSTLNNGSSNCFTNRKKRSSSHQEARDRNGGADDESVVKRICSWLCTLTLSISIGATLLLPISIVSNEVLLLYPTNKYLEWLNGMLIQGLWNLVFLFSNIGLFVLLPFAHLFIESEGFSGKKKGLTSKVQETIVVLFLAIFTVWGIAVIVNSFVNTRGASMLFHFNQLPFIYSFISFSGVLVFTLCTPWGLTHFFTILSANFIFVPEFVRNLEDEYNVAVLELEDLQNKKHELLKNPQHGSSAIHRQLKVNKQAELKQIDESIHKHKGTISNLENLRTTPPWKRNVLYPSLFIVVLLVTGLTVFIVAINAIRIITGFRDLSLEVVAKETLPLGRSSLSFLGPSGAIFEIILVMYLITTCLIGLYTLPWFKPITPVHSSTPATHLIFNSAILLVLSSALPVFMRILGLTNFDLLGTYAGKIDWIENTLIVVCVNLLFSALTCVCLLNNVTRKISHEIIRRFRLIMFF